MAGRPKLPYTDLKNFQGLFTKTSPEIATAEQLRVAENCDYFAKYGSISKSKGNARVLSSIYKESAVAMPISWVGFYKTPDLDGAILRHTLLATGTTLSRLETDGSLTTLTTGRKSGKFHSADRSDRFMFIANQNPDLVGDGNELVKYDGSVITKWGIEPPGSQPRAVPGEMFDDATDWTSSTDATVADESTTTFNGEGINVTKSGATTTSFHVERDVPTAFSPKGDARAIADTITNRVRFFLYIPRGSLTASDTVTGGILATSGRALSVYVSKDLGSVTTNYWRFDLEIGSLVEGWNTITLDFSSGTPVTPAVSPAPLGTEVGTFDPDTDTIKAIRIEWITVDSTAATAAAVLGYRLSQFEALDEGAPVTAVGASTGSFTGNYSYKVTFISKYGRESNAGPATVTLTTSADTEIALTRLPTSDDNQVVARRIYRTVANGSIWLFLDDVFDNTTTTYSDIVADGSLGTTTPPQAGDFSDDNARPPKGAIIRVWKKTVFLAGDPQNPETLYFSEDDEPESFPLINSFQLDAKITAMYETYSGMVVETETGKWQVIGDNPDFSVDKIVEGMGCVGRRAAGTARLVGYAIDRDGMRTFDLSNTEKISEPIRDKYDTDIDKGNIELIHTVHSKANNNLLQFNPDSSGDYTSIFNYIYPIDDVTQGHWAELVTASGANLNFLDAEEIEDADGNFKVYAGGDDGMLYELFCSTAKNWVNAQGTSFAIDTNFRTPYLRLGELGAETESATGRVLPRFVEIRAEGDAATWNVTVDMAEGSSQPVPTTTVSFDMDFEVNNSLIRQAVPIETGPVHPAPYFRIKLQNNQINVATRVLAVRVYFHVQEGQYEIIDLDTTT